MASEWVSFNQAWLSGKEIEYVQKAVQGSLIAGNGPFTKRCEQFLESKLNCKRAFLTTSCTDALEMAALLLDISPGDEFIVPSYTFVSTANAFVLRGGTPIFVDIRPDTLNLDETKLESKISPRTKAILVVHYAGVGVEMETVMKIANKHNIPVVEDNAHGLLGTFEKKSLGRFGCLSTLSFHETKNFSCGEGGALLINDEKYIRRAEILRDKGTNRNQFFRGEVDKYTWVDIGSSFLPSDILAAFLLAQFEHHEFIQSSRKKLWETYYQALGTWALENLVKLPYVPPHCGQAYHMFYLLLPTLAERDRFLAHMKNLKISSVFHYQPLHLSPEGVKLGGRKGQCPVTESVSDCLARLPFYTGMNEETVARVIAGVRSFKMSQKQKIAA